MGRFWRREPDPKVVSQLEESKQQLEEVHSRTSDITALADYLATRRQRNHFGDDLTLSFTPRSRHV